MFLAVLAVADITFAGTLPFRGAMGVLAIQLLIWAAGRMSARLAWSAVLAADLAVLPGISLAPALAILTAQILGWLLLRRSSRVRITCPA